MREVIVSCVFPPEPVVSAQTSALLAHELVRQGHAVTVITGFPNRPAGRIYPGYQRSLFQRQIEPNGMTIIRCFSTLSPKSGNISRFLENITFGLSAACAVLVSRSPSVIYANTWPVFATGLLSVVAKLRGVPLVMSVQDVYPESLVAQHRMGTGHALIRVMRWMDGVIARNCQAVIVISESFAKTYREQRRVPAERLHYIPNWVDAALVVPNDELGTSFRTRYGIPANAFVVAYGGNIGMAAGVEGVIEAFRYLQSVENLYLIIAGDGSNLAACQRLAQQINPPRIIFHTPWLSTETSALLSAANLLILPTRGKQSLQSEPLKLIVYMLAEKPIIATALEQSDLATSMNQSGCGWVVEPDHPEALAAKVLEVYAMPVEQRVQRGLSGRRYALNHYTSEACLPKIIDILEHAAKRGA